jgi:hypothetical protein
MKQAPHEIRLARRIQHPSGHSEFSRARDQGQNIYQEFSNLFVKRAEIEGTIGRTERSLAPGNDVL